MIDAIAALANRFWRIHPREIQDLGITREQFYAQEMRALFATQVARIEQLEAELKLTKKYLNEGGRIILANVARIEQLEKALRECTECLALEMGEDVTPSGGPR